VAGLKRRRCGERATNLVAVRADLVDTVDLTGDLVGGVDAPRSRLDDDVLRKLL